MKNELIKLFKLLTVCLERAINMRELATKENKLKYRKLAKSLEKSLKALDDAINLIGE